MSVLDRQIDKLYKNGQFTEAKEHLKTALFNSILDKDFETSLQIIKYSIRIHTELEEPEEIKNLFRIVQLNEDFQKRCYSDAHFFYYKAIAENSLNHWDEALKNLELSLQLAEFSRDRRALVNATIAKLKIKSSQGIKPSEEVFYFKELEKICTNLAELNDPDLWIVYHLLEAEIYLSLKKLDHAVLKVWKAFDLIKESETPQFYTISVFAMLGYIYFSAQDLEKAKIYLEIAIRSLQATSMNRTLRIVQSLLDRCPSNKSISDIEIDLMGNKVNFKSKKSISLKSQFVLIEIIRVIFESGRVPISKKVLVERVWKEAYNPKIHDNLIYVSINRVKAILDDEGRYGKDVLQRNKDGYFFNPKINITMNQHTLKEGEV